MSGLHSAREELLQACRHGGFGVAHPPDSPLPLPNLPCPCICPLPNLLISESHYNICPASGGLPASRSSLSNYEKQAMKAGGAGKAMHRPPLSFPSCRKGGRRVGSPCHLASAPPCPPNKNILAMGLLCSFLHCNSSSYSLSKA